MTMRGVDSVNTEMSNQQQQQHTITAFPPASTSTSYTATMSSTSDTGVDVTKLMLSEQEDSGLGSLNGFPSILNSIELEGQDNHNLRDELGIDSTQNEANPRSTKLMSLTSELDRLRLSSPACKDTNQDVLRDSVRIAHENRKVVEQHDSLLCDNDSGNYSITTTSTAPTELYDGSNVAAQHTEAIRDSRTNIKMDDKVNEETDYFGVFSPCDVSPEQRVAFYQGDADGDNCLHLSIIHRQVAQAETVIRLAPDYVWLSFSNLLRQTPLHLAVLTGQTHLVRRLVCAGAIVDAQDRHGDTPLHCACRMGHENVVKSLLAPVRYEETRHNSWEIPYQRLPQDLGVLNFEGQTPLHVAVLSGHEGVAKLLLEAGADPNVGEAKSGRTVLHMAAERGLVGMVELLVDSPNLDLLQRNYAGYTAAQLAEGRKFYPIANFLHSFCDDLSDAESDMTVVDTDSDSDCSDVGME